MKPDRVATEITEREEIHLKVNSADSMIGFVSEVARRGKAGWTIVEASVVFERKRYPGVPFQVGTPRKGRKR